MAPAVKVTVSEGGKESRAFKDALKVSIVASLYKIQVDWAKCIPKFHEIAEDCKLRKKD